jgi:hypothetical protein
LAQFRLCLFHEQVCSEYLNLLVHETCRLQAGRCLDLIMLSNNFQSYVFNACLAKVLIGFIIYKLSNSSKWATQPKTYTLLSHFRIWFFYEGPFLVLYLNSIVQNPSQLHYVSCTSKLSKGKGQFKQCRILLEGILSPLTIKCNLLAPSHQRKKIIGPSGAVQTVSDSRRPLFCILPSSALAPASAGLS